MHFYALFTSPNGGKKETTNEGKKESNNGWFDLQSCTTGSPIIQVTKCHNVAGVCSLSVTGSFVIGATSQLAAVARTHLVTDITT